MKKIFDPSLFTYVNVDTPKTSHIIPIEADGKVEIQCRSDQELTLNFVTTDGETVPQEVGKILSWNGLLTGCSGVEIVANTSFWYQCHKSNKWWEIPDPTPMQIQLVQKPEDIIRSLIDERLRVWKYQQGIEHELSEDEKDELVLDIVNGDLEFDDHPDDFGLGYEERLEEYVQRHAEQSNPEGVPAEEPENAPPPGAADTATVRPT